MVMLGTKWPSITSTWIQSAPAAMTSPISAPRRAKSAARIEGEMMSGLRVTVGGVPRRRPDHRAGGGGDRLGGEAEVGEERAAGRGFAKAGHADEDPLRADPAVPAEAQRRLTPMRGASPS